MTVSISEYIVYYDEIIIIEYLFLEQITFILYLSVY